MEQASIIIWALITLIPINGLIWLGMRHETKKQRMIYIRMWEVRNRRNLNG